MNWITSGLNSPIQKPRANSGATRTARVFATGTCEQYVKIQNSWWESINYVFMLITVHSVTRKICPHLRKFLDEMINLNEGVGTLQDIVESRKRRSMKQETAAYQYYRKARKLLWVLSSGCSIFWFLQKQKCTVRNNRNFCYLQLAGDLSVQEDEQVKKNEAQHITFLHLMIYNTLYTTRSI